MCSASQNVKVLPVQSKAGQVGELRINRTPETKAMFPSRAPAIRVRGGAVVIGRESTSLNGDGGGQ